MPLYHSHKEQHRGCYQGGKLLKSVESLAGQPQLWARSEAGLSRLPVTEKIAGSNPVGPAKQLFKLLREFFVFLEVA